MTYLRGVRVNRGATLTVTDINNLLSNAQSATLFNDNLSAAFSALVFNEGGFTVPNKAAVCNDAAFTFANNALMFREAGLSIANINAIIIHVNITDDNAQQILSEITKANRDLTSADNIYEILDDWNDNKLTARDGAGTTSTGFTNLFAHKDKFRPVWTTVTGSPSASGGECVLTGDGTDQHITTPSSFVTGTWEIDVYIQSGGAAGICAFYPFSDNNTHSGTENGYHHTIFYSSGFDIDRMDNGVKTKILDGGNPFGYDAFHIVKLTRDGSGNWEEFYDGVSKGTVLDNTYTTSNYIQIVNDNFTSGKAMKFDNLKVY